MSLMASSCVKTIIISAEESTWAITGDKLSPFSFKVAPSGERANMEHAVEALPRLKSVLPA